MSVCLTFFENADARDFGLIFSSIHLFSKHVISSLFWQIWKFHITMTSFCRPWLHWTLWVIYIILIFHLTYDNSVVGNHQFQYDKSNLSKTMERLPRSILEDPIFHNNEARYCQEDEMFSPSVIICCSRVTSRGNSWICFGQRLNRQI